MYCMKCGTKTAEEQAFCARCLEEMDRYPVRSDVPILLPQRAPAPAVKKAAPKKKRRTPKEQVVILRKVVKYLLIALVSITVVLSLTIALLIQALPSDDPGSVIGQNYSTVDDSDGAD